MFRRIQRAASSSRTWRESTCRRKQLAGRKWRRLLAFERTLNVQCHAAAELLIVDGNFMRTGIEANLAANGPHAFGQTAPEKQLSIDAQLDLVVAAGEKLDRLRLRNEEIASPPDAEILAGKSGLLVEEPQIDFVRSRIRRCAAECQLRENRADRVRSGGDSRSMIGGSADTSAAIAAATAIADDPARCHDASSISFAARSTTSVEMPARQSGTRPRQRAGGCRIRLQGLHEMSMRTILDRADNGAYRVGRDGPKIASTGVSTAAARCIGPVSPVMNSGEPLEYGRQQHEIDVGRQFHERDITGPRRPHGVDHRFVLRRSDEHNRDIARVAQARRPLPRSGEGPIP